MEISAEAEKIVSQAAQWSFEGDCSLLKLMQEVSLNLGQRANNTCQALDKLSANVKRTGIALDNAANSLTALQYTQFVESRCHDDDETIANVAEVPVDVAAKSVEQPQSSAEILKTFLQNNLRMLHNSHEKYSLDFEESDEEEAAVNNFIYQPKNPYNVRPLPHIYGTKLWKENWHVGLCDGSNDYSGDEMSEAFSDTSTSEENESFESSSALTSEWNSTASMLNDKYATNIAVLGSQPLFPAEQQRTVPAVVGAAALPAVDSAAKSSPMTSIATTLPDNTYGHDLFASPQNTPSTSSTCSADVSAAATRLSQDSSLSGTSKQGAALQQHNLLTDASTPISAQQNVEHVRTPVTAAIKRKAVNLFDDDDFNSFMSEIVDKAQARVDTPTAAPRKSATVAPKSAAPTAARETVTAARSNSANKAKVNDLFDSRSNSPTPTVEPSRPQLATLPVAIDNTRKQNQPLNLFDSPDASPEKELLFPISVSKSDKLTSSTKLFARSLFDDDDDDDGDDFLNAFGSTKVNVSTMSKGKPLFHDSDEETQIQNQTQLFDGAVQKSLNENKSQLFDEDEKVVQKNKPAQYVKEAPPKQRAERNLDLFTDDSNDENELITSRELSLEPKTDVAVGSSSISVLSKPAVLFTESEESNMFDTISARSTPPLVVGNRTVEDTTTAEVKAGVGNAGATKTTASEVGSRTSTFFETEDDELKTAQPLKQASETQNENPSVLLEKEYAEDTLATFSNAKATSEETESVAAVAIETVEQQEENVKQFKGAENVQQVVAVDTIKDNSLTKENIAVSENAIASLQVDTSSNSSDSSLESATAQATVAKAVLNYTSLFLDEPPDDDDFFKTLGSNTLSFPKFNNDLEADFYEPALPTLPIDTQKETSSQKEPANIASDYSDLRLFSEVPPDDDDDETNDFSVASSGRSIAESKHIHGVFYDDFNETRAALKATNALKQPFIDEPPIDSENASNAATLAENRDIVTSKSAATAHIDAPNEELCASQSALTDETDKATVSSADKAQIPRNVTPTRASEKTAQPSTKLPKVNINVQALLPATAGRPSFKKSAAAKADTSADQNNTVEDAGYQESTAVAATAQHSPQTAGANMLTSMCKHRVKAPAQRRPSTRRGRHENYRKSLLAEQAGLQAELPQSAPIISSELQDGEMLSVEEVKTSPPTLPQLLPLATKSKDESHSSAAFISDDDDKRIDFETTSRKQPISTTVPNLFLAETPPEDLLFTIPMPAKNTGAAQEAATNTQPVDSRNLLADIDSEADGADWLTHRSSKPVATKSLATAAFNSGKDESQIKKEKMHSVEQPLAAPALPTVITDNTVTSAKARQVAARQQQQPQSLFFDEESNSDEDLFKGSTVSQRVNPTTQPQPPAASAKEQVGKLFGSDSDDNDDFLGALTNKPKLEARTSKLPAKESKGLFSDAESDDDDDLFSTKKPNAPMKLAATQTRQVHTKKQSTPTATDAEVHDNPLADLLK